MVKRSGWQLTVKRSVWQLTVKRSGWQLTVKRSGWQALAAMPRVENAEGEQVPNPQPNLPS